MVDLRKFTRQVSEDKKKLIAGQDMRHKLLVLLAGIMMLASACTEESMQLAATGGGSNAGKTAAERQLEQQAKSLNQVSRDIIVKNTVEGAIIGAAAGCGAALLFGGNRQDCVRGAVVGGVVGGVGGNAVGRKAAAKNEEIVKTAEVVKNLSQVSRRLNGVEANLRTVLRSQDAEIRSLKRQVASGQVSDRQYRARVNAINSNRKVVSNELLKSEQNIVKASAEIASARRQGQGGLGTAAKAASSNKSRLARVRSGIKTVDS